MTEQAQVVAGGGLIDDVEEHIAMRERLFKDPLTAPTEKRRTHLMFTACFSILLSVYGLKVSKTPWLEFEVPSGAPDLLAGALSLALLYTFVVFAFFAWTDMARWRASGDILNLDAMMDRLLNARGQLNSLSKRLDAPDVTSTPPEKWKDYVSGGFAFVNHFDDSYRKLIQSKRSLTIAQAFRIYVLELGVPLALGIVAIFKISWAIFPFLALAAA